MAWGGRELHGIFRIFHSMTHFVKQTTALHTAHVRSYRNGSGTLTKYGNWTWVTTKVSNILLYPLQSKTLILYHMVAILSMGLILGNYKIHKIKPPQIYWLIILLYTAYIYTRVCVCIVPSIHNSLQFPGCYHRPESREHQDDSL